MKFIQLKYPTIIYQSHVKYQDKLLFQYTIPRFSLQTILFKGLIYTGKLLVGNCF